MRSIKEADIIAGTIVLVRTDWNVPIKDGVILDTSRIEASLQTINFALDKGAKVIVISHLGDGADSLEPVVKEAEKFFPNIRLRFVRDPWNASSVDGKQALADLRGGEIAVLENLRFWMEKENDEDFAKQLASFADIYVNDAFSVSHRKHTSIVKLPTFLAHFAGFHFLEEYKNLSSAFNPAHPFLFILGGAKFETKLPLVEKFLNIADTIFIGGTNAFQALSLPISQNPKVILPVGDITALDVNIETLEMLERKIQEAKFILWNGPLGKYEDGYVAGTKKLAEMLNESGAKVVIGGGDTENVIDELQIKNPNIFISLAGGAMLEFLSTGTLVGIEALE